MVPRVGCFSYKTGTETGKYPFFSGRLISSGFNKFIRVEPKTPDWPLKLCGKNLWSLTAEESELKESLYHPVGFKNVSYLKWHYPISTKLLLSKVVQIFRTLMGVIDQPDLVLCVVTRVARLDWL